MRKDFFPWHFLHFFILYKNGGTFFRAYSAAIYLSFTWKVFLRDHQNPNRNYPNNPQAIKQNGQLQQLSLTKKAHIWLIIKQLSYSSIILSNNNIYNLMIFKKSAKENIRKVINKNRSINNIMHSFNCWLINLLK